MNNKVYSSDFRTVNSELSELVNNVNIYEETKNFSHIYCLVNDLYAR